MKVTDTLGKVIWRNPEGNIVYCLQNGEGDDEFIIAPFKKTEPLLSIKGAIKEVSGDAINNFFEDITLSKNKVKHSTSEEYYIQSIESAITAINQLDFEKVVLARQFCIEKTINLISLFKELTKQYPHAFVYCFALENGNCMIGATPETLLEKHGGILTTEALGGTEQDYGYSEKEYEEHRQIITDISNKLDSLEYDYQPSSIEVKTAGNVAHLSTQFTVKSKTLAEDLRLLDKLHPTAAICGLPYQPAYDFLLKNENFDRHYYTGYLGIRTNGNFNFYVNLRCADIMENSAVLYAGAGINKNSVPENEWSETSHKLDTLLRWMV